MIKKISISILTVLILFTTACGNGSAIVMPFEATFHKYVYQLSKDLEKIDFSENFVVDSENSYSVLCENENFAIVLQNDTIAFLDKKENSFTDTFGNTTNNMPNSGLNIRITQGENYNLEYKSGKYYNSESDEYIDSLTAYKINDNTVRLFIITGIDEFSIIGKQPLVLTPEYVNSNEKLKIYYSNENTARVSVLNEYPLLEERLSLIDDLYYMTKDIPENEFYALGLTKNTSREVALQLNYDYSSVKMLLTTVDITFDEDRIVFDISKNRQFRSELIRDKSFIHEIFEFEIDFVEKTASESKKITDAQSKY